MYGNEEGSEVGPRGTFETYRAEGDTLFKQGEYRKAIESYTTALELQDTEKNCLVARSRCYLQLGDTDKALTDAEASLSEDKDFHKGLYQNAEALYCQGEFELALVFYHRGHKLRTELQEFRLGIQKAQEAIDNSVGSPEKVQLTKEGDLSFFVQQDEKQKAKPKTYGAYKRPTTKQRSLGTRDTKSAGSEKTIKQLLGELYGDKCYLEKLLRETVKRLGYKDRLLLLHLTDTSTDSGRSIYELVLEGLKYLDTRTEFWRQQKPMYARKRDKLLQQARMSSKKGDPNAYVLKTLEEIDEAQAAGRNAESIRLAKRCLQTVRGYDEGSVHNKAEVLANLHSCLGNAYLEDGDYQKALDNHTKDFDLAEEHGLEDAKSRSLDNLGRVYARMGEFQKAIDVWTTKLPLSKSPLESTWLYHEIGRCHLESGNHSEARDFGEKSAAAAQEAADEMWQLNATVLIAQADVKLGEHQSALDNFQKALDLAQVQGDDAAEAAIKRAMDEVNNRIVRGLKEAEEAEAKEEAKEETAEEKQDTETETEKDSPKEEEKSEDPVEEEKTEEPTTEEKKEEKTEEETPAE